jgi:hypothetical protein
MKGKRRLLLACLGLGEFLPLLPSHTLIILKNPENFNIHCTYFMFCDTFTVRVTPLVPALKQRKNDERGQGKA